MRCQFKKPDGQLCKYSAERNNDFCVLHDPKNTAVIFTADCDNYKKNKLIKLPKNKANYYLHRDIAIRLDKKLYEIYKDKKNER